MARSCWCDSITFREVWHAVFFGHNDKSIATFNETNGTVYDSLTKSSGRAPETLQTPLTLKLYQNYPNPLAARGVRNQIFTSIDFDFEAAQPMPTQLKIFDIHGREVATLVNEVLEPKYHQVFFDASTLPGGTYFYRLRIGEAMQMKKLVLLR